MALPGYIGGVLEKLGLPLLLALAVGFVATLVIAHVMAQLFVRLPGVFLAIGTLAFGFVVEGLARAFPAWTGGASGLIFVFGRQLDPLLWYVASLAALALGLALYASLVRGATWRRLRTIRHDELAAAVLGIDVAREKARAYAIGSGFAAAAGILLTGYVGVLIPENAGVDALARAGRHGAAGRARHPGRAGGRLGDRAVAVRHLGLRAEIRAPDLRRRLPGRRPLCAAGYRRPRRPPAGVARCRHADGHDRSASHARCIAGGARCCAGRRQPRGGGCVQALRRRGGGRGHQLRGPPRRGLHHRRPERCRQDHAVQPDLRRRAADLRRASRWRAATSPTYRSIAAPR